MSKPRVALAALVFLVAGFAGATAQMGHQPGDPGMGMPQDPMHQMQDMMQRMNGIMHQAHQMAQTMQQHMQEQHGQMMEQHQMMQRMDECVRNMAEHMQAAMEQHQRMMQDAAFMHDPETQHDMEKLREHMGDMTDQLEQSVQMLQRLNHRLAPSSKE